MFLPQNNLAYPVLIEIADATSGSGFYWNRDDALYLATARHVLFKDGLELHRKEATLTSNSHDLATKCTIKFDIGFLFDNGHVTKHDHADVAVVKLGVRMGGVLALVGGVTAEPPGAQLTGVGATSMKLFDEVEISNTIFLFGYPTSLGKTAQIDRSSPLLRRGIIAGKTNSSRIVIDCPVYFGNSGGLVIEVEEGANRAFKAIGVAVEMVPFGAVQQTVRTTNRNSF